MSKKISEYSHSEIGSAHWFNTLIGSISHTGEFMHEHGFGEVREDVLKEWGKAIQDRAKELSEWFNCHKERDIETAVTALKEALEKLNPPVL